MEDFIEAEKALKQALKLDNDDQEIEDLLQEVMMVNRSGVT